MKTHVLSPGDVVEWRIGLDVALEVDVVAFSNVLRVQTSPEHNQGHRNV